MGSLSQYNLDYLIEKYNTSIFFETGSARGDGIIEALKHNFKQIISVEINEKQVQILKNSFNQPNIDIICGNSFDILEEKIKNIDENILFWLDAHYPGADLIENCGERINAYMAESNDDIRLPLEKEMQIIKKYRSNKKDVILFDDLTIYKNHGNLIGDDAYYLKPRQQFSSSEFYKDIFNETHKFELVCETQGMLIPK